MPGRMKDAFTMINFIWHGRQSGISCAHRSPALYEKRFPVLYLHDASSTLPKTRARYCCRHWQGFLPASAVPLIRCSSSKPRTNKLIILSITYVQIVTVSLYRFRYAPMCLVAILRFSRHTSAFAARQNPSPALIADIKADHGENASHWHSMFTIYSAISTHSQQPKPRPRDLFSPKSDTAASDRRTEIMNTTRQI